MTNGSQGVAVKGRLNRLFSIVFENLKGWRATGGRKRSILRQRFHGWLKSAIRQYTEMKWQEIGGKTIDVIAAYTSKLAYDGSGVVRRDSGNYALATFSSGKRYSADLNGSANIGARGTLKLTCQKDSEERFSKILDVRLEAGLVCAICGIDLQVSIDTSTSLLAGGVSFIGLRYNPIRR